MIVVINQINHQVLHFTNLISSTRIFKSQRIDMIGKFQCLKMLSINLKGFINEFILVHDIIYYILMYCTLTQCFKPNDYFQT